MTQPAQSSGHEWTGHSLKRIGCCSCGAYCNLVGPRCEDWHRYHVANVASVAQAAPQEQVHFCHDNACTDRPLRKHPCHAESCPERLDASYPVAHPNLAPVTREWVVATEKQLDADTTAQPQEVPAEQRDETDEQWLERIRTLLPEGSPIPLFHNADGSINREKVMELPCFLWAIQRQAESAAQPPAEELKAQARKLAADWCYNVYAWRGRSPGFMQGQLTKLADFIVSFIRARERELLEKLEGLAQKWDEVASDSGHHAEFKEGHSYCAEDVRVFIAKQRGK